MLSDLFVIHQIEHLANEINQQRETIITACTKIRDRAGNPIIIDRIPL
jgi:hypothetical protein